MTGDPNDAGARALRQRAEAILAQRKAAARRDQLGALDARILHELEVHQIELEMQNEELRDARAKLEALVERYTDLYDAAPAGYLTLTAEGVIVEANLTVALLLAVPRARLLGQRLARWIAEADQPALATFLRQLLTGAEHPRCDVIVARPGQPPRTLELDGVRAADGATGRVVLLDVTAQRAAESAARLRSEALDAAPDAVLIADQAGCVTWSNVAFTTLTGHEGTEVVGRSLDLLIDPAATEDLFARDVWPDIATGRIWHGEVIGRRKDGTGFPMDLTITPLRDERGMLRHYAAVARDLTEAQALQTRLIASEKMESVARIAGGVAHDFNNLLTVITGTAGLGLASLGDDHPLAADLREIRDSAERAAALTRQLLAFGRRQILMPRTVSLQRVITDTETVLRRTLGDAVTLTVALDTPLGHIHADPAQLQLALINLAANARDAMPAGGTLTIAARNDLGAPRGAPAAPPGAWVTLSVADTGVGMSEATRRRAFEPFFTTKSTGQGSGLGLSTVYGIVTQSGGSIHIDSAPGQGTVVTIWLPRLSDASGESPRGTDPRPSGGGTVLVVDDETAIRSVVARILRSAGYTVMVAPDGAAALEVLAASAAEVHLLLTDIVMPGLGGHELARMARAQYPHLRVLLMSGHTDDELLRLDLAAQATPFISKPFTVEELTQRVHRALASQ